MQIGNERTCVHVPGSRSERLNGLEFSEVPRLRGRVLNTIRHRLFNTSLFACLLF